MSYHNNVTPNSLWLSNHTCKVQPNQAPIINTGTINGSHIRNKFRKKKPASKNYSWLTVKVCMHKTGFSSVFIIFKLETGGTMEIIQILVMIKWLKVLKYWEKMIWWASQYTHTCTCMSSSNFECTRPPWNVLSSSSFIFFYIYILWEI